MLRLIYLAKKAADGKLNRHAVDIGQTSGQFDQGTQAEARNRFQEFARQIYACHLPGLSARTVMGLLSFATTKQATESTLSVPRADGIHAITGSAGDETEATASKTGAWVTEAGDQPAMMLSILAHILAVWAVLNRARNLNDHADLFHKGDWGTYDVGGQKTRYIHDLTTVVAQLEEVTALNGLKVPGTQTLVRPWMIHLAYQKAHRMHVELMQHEGLNFCSAFRTRLGRGHTLANIVKEATWDVPRVAPRGGGKPDGDRDLSRKMANLAKQIKKNSRGGGGAALSGGRGGGRGGDKARTHSDTECRSGASVFELGTTRLDGTLSQGLGRGRMWRCGHHRLSGQAHTMYFPAQVFEVRVDRAPAR